MKTTKVYYDLEFLEGSQTERFLGIELRKWNNAYAYLFAGIAIIFTFILAINLINGIGRSNINLFGSIFFWYLFLYYAWNGKPERWINKPTIDLISIGMVREDGQELYLISKDFNLKEAWERYQVTKDAPVQEENGIVEYWIRENVLLPIFKELSVKEREDYKPSPIPHLLTFLMLQNPFLPAKKREFTYKNLKRLINKYGHTNAEIATNVEGFCKVLNPITPADKPLYQKIELYGYYSAYDHVCLCWLFGKMIDLPDGFPMFTIDLKQMLDAAAETRSIIVRSKDGFSQRTHNVRDHYKTTFEDMLTFMKEDPKYPKQTNEHSAIFDARFNRDLHIFIQSL